MGIVDRGDRVISQKRSTTVVPEGNLFVLNPEEPHACGSLHEEGHSYRIVAASTDFVQAVASQISCKQERVPHFPRLSMHDRNLEHLTRHLFSLVEAGAPLLGQQAALTSLFSGLVLSYATEAPAMHRVDSQRAPILRAREFIDEHFAENLSLEQLAQIACLSPFHFQRVFVSVVGVSPHEYLIQLRLRRARELLGKGMSIPHVALETGFADQSHFTRFFKRAMGITPGHYTRMYDRSHSAT